jgi:4-alpha-glucanotransferase
MSGRDLTKVAAVLTPVSALRAEGCLGIGDTAALKDFIGWAAECGFKVVKLLPINETGGDNSPYNAISSRALEPALLRVHPESTAGLSTRDFERLTALEPLTSDSDSIDYGTVKKLKLSLLRCAFNTFAPASCNLTALQTDFENFELDHQAWLPPYTLFRVLTDRNLSEQWRMWPEEQQSFEDAVGWLETLDIEERNSVERDRSFYAFVQWQADRQWRDVRLHAESLNVQLMGDIPFGVNFCSADVWANRGLFKEGWCGGTPPDKMFTHDRFVQEWGQNWGIPLYDWQAMRRDDFAWWRQRVRGVREFFHLFRIDHVLGFYRIYGFPWPPEQNESFLNLSLEEVRGRCEGRIPGFQPRPDDTEEDRAENCAEGAVYLGVVLEEAGDGNVIGEDLGEVPEYVRPNLTSLGIAGYKVPQWEKRPDGSLIPGDEYERLSIATYGTHDHEPLLIYWRSLVEASRESSDGAKNLEEHLRFLEWTGEIPDELTDRLHEAFLTTLFASNSWIAVVMITDVFKRGERFNLPGIGHGNWTQRMHAKVDELRHSAHSVAIARLIREAGRIVQA